MDGYQEEQGPQGPEDFLDRTSLAAEAGDPGDPEESLWDSQDALDSLKMERTVVGDETPADQTKRMLEEAGPMAAASIIHVALHSNNDNTRFAASRFIIEHNREEGVGEGVFWEKLVADVVSGAELLANSPSAPPGG